MKNLFFLTFLFGLVLSFTFSGCKKEDPAPVVAVDEYALLSGHLKSASLDLDKMLNSFVLFPAAETDVAPKYIMDLRSAADYANGHIANAVNVEFKNILTEAAKASGKPILVVCYTGQISTYATTLLRLYGYSDASALKWGMSGWNATFDKWTANCKDLKSDANWNTDVVTSATFGTPKLATGLTTGSEILKKRVEDVVAAGFKSIAPAVVLASPADYYINTYISAAHYTGFGHIKGAYRINPILISDGTISNLDPSRKIVTLCYTGHTSGSVAAWLNVLGYDSYTLLWGLNGTTYTNTFWNTPVTNHWGFDSKTRTFTTVK
ncbi:MAG: rhodanese-like domain-containing protein [Bacteroidia bacterium]|nr:rhodanese-like domain-containing protein [Bacteroidia bacterium]